MNNEIFNVTLKVHWLLYVGTAISGSVALRIFLSLLRSLEQGKSKLGKHWWVAFKGFDAQEPFTNDYWQTWIIGVLELISFPILLASGYAQYIGGWLIIKTLPQWTHWQNRRWVYNRFLIGNAIILLIAYFMTKLFII